MMGVIITPRFMQPWYQALQQCSVTNCFLLSRDIVAVFESLAAWFNIKLHALFNSIINFQSSEKHPIAGGKWRPISSSNILQPD